VLGHDGRIQRGSAVVPARRVCFFSSKSKKSAIAKNQLFFMPKLAENNEAYFFAVCTNLKTVQQHHNTFFYLRLCQRMKSCA
jgi:hypothetical protein